MNATKIESGHLLKGEDLIVRVASLRFKPGYRTPWIIDLDGNAYRPSDFAGFAVTA